jgi:uncharacterized membrane protein
MTRRFWRGFTLGAVAGAGCGIGGFLLISSLVGSRKDRIVRLEKSLQIGRPVAEVFDTWANLEALPQISDCVQDIRRYGNRSHWAVQVDGRTFEWDAEVEQMIPNQAIGWKTLNGPKHTGRITFSPIGNDTLVQVTMNYAPPSRLLKPLVENSSGLLERYIEQVLRDFKAALEGKGQEGRKPAVRGSGYGSGAEMTQTEATRATGTFGPSSGKPLSPGQVMDRFDGGSNPVDYSAPPEAKR